MLMIAEDEPSKGTDDSNLELVDIGGEGGGGGGYGLERRRRTSSRRSAASVSSF